MLSRDETLIFACLLKKLGSEVTITLEEMENLRGYKVEWERRYDSLAVRYRLVRIGVTLNGESSPASPNPEHFRGAGEAQVSTPLQVRGSPVRLDVPHAPDSVPERTSESLWDATTKRLSSFFGEEG